MHSYVIQVYFCIGPRYLKLDPTTAMDHSVQFMSQTLCLVQISRRFPCQNSVFIS